MLWYNYEQYDSACFRGYLPYFLRDIWACMCSPYYYDQIGKTYISHCFHIFRGSVPEVECTIICCRFHIYSGKAGFRFLLLMCSLWCVHYGPMVIFVCLYITLPHWHHYTDVSGCIELLERLSGTFCRVCVQDEVISLNCLFCNIWCCVCFSLPIYLMMIVQIRVLYGIIIIKSEVLPLCHYLGLGQETKVYVVCLPIFLLTASCMKVLLFA